MDKLKRSLLIGLVSVFAWGLIYTIIYSLLQFAQSLENPMSVPVTLAVIVFSLAALSSYLEKSK